ncbi:MAG TPA: hydroxymethylbilane synthase [Candidatus Saccharimonadales bacterium]|nr:hydroxymethylbilane synthase [Candidatus Saccharimonadales bacterium]
MTLVLGTRGSALALVQSRVIAAALGPDVELRIVTTTGDTSAAPLSELGDGVFVTAIEEALRRGEIDLAVHSLKDLPTAERGDLCIAAIPVRADPRDVLITAARGGLASLRQAASVGTSSPRRDAFLRALRPDVTTRAIRGNVDTRLRKVLSGEYDATILAAAGLERLGIAFAPDEALDLFACPPAPGQGALAVQCRTADTTLRARLAPLDDAPTRVAVTTERALLAALGASCALALGAFARCEGGRVILDAALDDGGLRHAHAEGTDLQAVAVAAADALRGARV